MAIITDLDDNSSIVEKETTNTDTALNQDEMEPAIDEMIEPTTDDMTGPATDEMLTEESEITEDDDEELDFTKPTPMDMLPDKMKGFRPPKVKSRIKKVKFEDCSCEEESGNEEDVVEEENEVEKSPRGRKKKRKVKEDNGSFFTGQRIVALVVLFPMLSSGGYMLYEALGKFKFEKSMQQMIATLSGAAVAIIIMSRFAVLRSALKFVLCFAWIVFLIPTYQVYTCSPITLKNDMLGTWFKLQTTAGRFVESSYTTSLCFQSSKFPTPYKLSVITPKITLKVDISELINLNMENEVPDEDLSQRISYFLLISKRSVKKKFHKIYLILEAPHLLAQKLENSLKLSSKEKDKNLLLITGSVYDLDEPLEPMKKELEKMNYHIRPMKLKVQNVEYTDRYVKLKHNPDEHLY